MQSKGSPAEPYRLPVTEIIDAVQSGDTATVTISLEPSLESYLSYPIAPADLRREVPFEAVFPLHQLVGRSRDRLVFETYVPLLPLPRIGSTFEFCSWWTSEAMEAVRDITAEWDLVDYPDTNDHDHCLITWQTISRHEGEARAYGSRYGWITIAAYREYIERDALRVRTAWKSIEKPA